MNGIPPVRTNFLHIRVQPIDGLASVAAAMRSPAPDTPWIGAAKISNASSVEDAGRNL